MRPGTNAPSMHWAYIIYDAYRDLEGVSIVYDDGVPTLRLTKKLMQDNEIAFRHIMRFTKLHDIDFDIDRNECKNCPGHNDCVKNLENK